MYKKILLWSVLILIALNAESQKFISVKGTSMIGPDGKPLLLKGINTGNWLVPEGYMFKFKKTNSARMINDAFCELIGPSDAAAFWHKFLNSYITFEDIKYIKSLGFNHIRVPFNYRMFTDEYYMGQVNQGMFYLDRLVNWCSKVGLYVILDMHCAPGGQTGDNIDDSYGYPFLFENMNDQKLFTQIWVKLAGHYKNNPTILGYELLNEPIAPYFKDTATLNKKLEVVYKEATKAIRKVDKNHIIILGGAQWDGNFNVFGPPFDSKLVYAFHQYWMKPTYDAFKKYVEFGRKYNVPVFLTESGENTDEWITQYREALEQHNISWTFWTYKRMDTKSSVVSVTPPANWDKIVRFAETDRSTYANIRKARPDVDSTRVIMNEYLKNIQLQNCVRNNGYVKALGITTMPEKP